MVVLAGFLLFVKLHNIARLEIIEIFQADTALEAGGYFLNVVFKASQADHGSIAQHFTLVDNSDRQIPANPAIGNIAACYFATFTSRENSSDFDSPFNNTNDWSSDGSTLVIRRLDPKTGQDLWVAPARGGGKPVPFLRTPFHEHDGRLSPDGHWIAYHSDESGRNELYVQPFPAGGARIAISTDGAAGFEMSGDAKSVWTRDGKELIFLGGDGVTVMSAAVRIGATFEAAPAKPLFKLPAGTIDAVASPDGSRYLASVTEAGTLRSMAMVVIHWTAEMAKR